MQATIAFRVRSLVIATVAICAVVSEARAVELVANGGFEAGFTGWTRADQVGSDGTFFLQTGTTSPVNGQPVPAPPQGVTAAMTDAQGPGSHVLYQNFAVPAAVPSAVLSFDVFVGNRAVAFFTPDTLDFATPTLNQQARVDIMTAPSDPFSVAAGDVLSTPFRTNIGDPLVSGYTHIVSDLTSLLNAHLGQPLRLRFAEVDNVEMFQFGVDNVSLDVGAAQAVPEPASLALLLTAGLGLVWRAASRSRRLGGL